MNEDFASFMEKANAQGKSTDEVLATIHAGAVTTVFLELTKQLARQLEASRSSWLELRAGVAKK